MNWLAIFAIGLACAWLENNSGKRQAFILAVAGGATLGLIDWATA